MSGVGDIPPKETGILEKDAALSDTSSSKEQPHSDEQPDYPTGWKLWAILIGINAACLLTGLDVSIIGTAIPTITNRFHSTPDIGWYGAAYMLAVASLQPLGGKIYAVFPVKLTFLIFVCIFQFGSLLCATAVSSNMFIVGRAIAGSGAAGIFSGSIAIMRAIAPLDKGTLYTSLLFALFGITTVIGPTLGGALTQHASWRWCFYINLPIGGLTVIALIFFFHPPESFRSKGVNLTLTQKLQKLDLVGCLLFIPSICMLLLALEWGGNKFAWRSATIIGLFCGFGGLLAVFLTWEYFQKDEAMMPFSLLRNRSVIVASIISFFLTSALILCNYYLPEWFQIIKNASPQHSGVLMLPGVIAQVIGSIVSGAVTSRTGYFNQFAFIGPTLMCIALGMYTALTPHSGMFRYFPFQILQGLGGGLGFQVALTTVQVEYNKKQELNNIATGLVMFWTYFGSSTMTSVALTIFQNGVISNLRDAGFDDRSVKALLAAGATGARRVTEADMPEKLGVVLEAYNDALNNVFYIGIAGLVICFVTGAFIPWRNLKKESAPPPGASPKDVEAQNKPAKVSDA